MKDVITIPSLFVDRLCDTLRYINNYQRVERSYKDYTVQLMRSAISLIDKPVNIERILRYERNILFVLIVLIDNKFVNNQELPFEKIKEIVFSGIDGNKYKSSFDGLKGLYSIEPFCYVFGMKDKPNITTHKGSRKSIRTKIENLTNILSELSEDCEIINDKYSRDVTVLEDEVQDLKLKISQYEEDKKKSIPKGAAKAVTFNRIIDFIETCYKVDDTRPIVDMLYKLMRSGNVEEGDYKKIDDAVAKVQAKETQNRYGTTFNGPVYNSGTITGDINNNKESSEK